MFLSFNAEGDIKIQEESNTMGQKLFDASQLEAELGRFMLFFDTRRGLYKYAPTFGNNSSSLVGLSNIDMDEILLFNEELRKHLDSSFLLADFAITADFVDQHTIEISLTGGNSDPVLWRYYTKKGRLCLVEDQTPDTAYGSYIIHSREFKSNGSVDYDILNDLTKVKEINNIGLYDELTLSHRIFIIDEPGASGDQINTHNYAINDIEGTLEFTIPASPDKWIRLELWPTDHSNIQTTNNPYLMRKNL